LPKFFACVIIPAALFLRTRKVRGRPETSPRVVRGGAFNNNNRNVRGAYRNNNNPHNRNNNVGLRLVVAS
jgi:formylglycine-generating enzyme required for sulfatase activity